MRITIDRFSRPERKQSWYRLRLLKKGDVEKIGWRGIYWSVPFLVRLLAKIDEIADSDPEYALELATHSRRVAERIQVGKAEIDYDSVGERRDFSMLALSYYATALLLNGEEKQARMWTQKALEQASGVRPDADPFAVAEVYRRASFLMIKVEEFADASRYSEKAAEIFKQLGESDRLALCHLYLAQALYYQDQTGEALPFFCQALYYGAKSGSERGRRVVAAAAGSLAAVALTSEPFPDAAVGWVLAAKEAAYGQPTGIFKLKIHWVEALAGHRAGKSRWAINRLKAISRKLVEHYAFGEAAACVADLVVVVGKVEPESLQEVVQECASFLREATPESARSLVESWIERPTDVAPLRRLRDSHVTQRPSPKE